MGLLSFLFGSHPQQPNVAQGPSGTQYPMDPNGNIYAVPPQAPPQVAPGSLTQHLATVAPAAPLAASAAPPPPQPPMQDPSQPPAVNNPNPVGVMGDNWHPKKNGILGQVADFIFGTHIGRGIHRENMEAALKTLNSNPDLAIQRIAEFDPEEAEKLYQHVSSVKHYNAMIDRETSLTGLQQTKAFMPIAAGIMQHLSTDANGNPVSQIDPAAWATAQNQLMMIGSHYGMTPDQVRDLVPDNPDVNVAQSLAAGQFPVYRQAQQAEHKNEFKQTLPIKQQNADANSTRAQAAMIGAHTGQVNAATGQAREAYGEQHGDTMAAQGQARINLEQSKQPRMVMTKFGPLEVQGNVGILHRPDGTSLRYLTSDGVNFVPTHQKPKGK